MTPAIEPMAAGEMPTEPGWYVIQRENGDRDFVSGWRPHYQDEGVREFIVASTGEEVEASAVEREGWTFIARIYPERILGEPATA